MAYTGYTKVGPFVNLTGPALNATNLNKLEQGILDAHYPTLSNNQYTASEPGSSYPDGTSYMVISNEASWPESYGLVVTQKYLGRLVQLFYRNNATRTYQRTWDNNAWIDWTPAGSAMRTLSDADRLALTPLSGEMIFSSDTKTVYVGDGATPGGIPVGGGRIKETTLGNGTSTTFSYTHSLGTSSVICLVRLNAAPYSIVYPDIDITSDNAVSVTFPSPPTTNQYRLTVIAPVMVDFNKHADEHATGGSDPITPASIGAVVANSAITAATKCKVTYDAKGLVTAGADLAATDIPNLDMAKVTTGNLQTTRLSEPSYIQGSVSLTAWPLFDVVRGDRTAFLPASQIIIEQSTDAGVTWTDAGISDTNKAKLFTGQRPTISIPLKNGVKSTDCMIRITVTAMKYTVPEGTAETDKYSYWNPTNVTSAERYFSMDGGWIWLNSNSDRIYFKAELATGADPNTWVLQREAYMSGWSGGNFFTIPGRSFGGGTTQTSNGWNWRFTFRTATPNLNFNDAELSTSYPTQAQTINHIKTVGKSCYSYSNNLMYNDHLYNWDENKNAIFPTGITSGGTIVAGASGAGQVQAAKLTVSGHTDFVNGAPWYGFGLSDIDGEAGGHYVQVGGYYGLLFKTRLNTLKIADATGALTLNDNQVWHDGNGATNVVSALATAKPSMAGLTLTGPTIEKNGAGLWREFRNVLQYSHNLDASVGAIAIHTNISTASTSNTMFRVHVAGMLYDTTSPVELIASGYVYGGGTTLGNNKGYINVGSKRIRVRYARHVATDKFVIILGEDNESFHYPQISVPECYVGYNGAVDTQVDGWTVQRLADTTGYDWIVDVPDKTAMDWAGLVNKPTSAVADIDDAVSKRHTASHTFVGSTHTASGLTAGHVLKATGATTFAFGALSTSDVSEGTNQYYTDAKVDARITKAKIESVLTGTISSHSHATTGPASIDGVSNNGGNIDIIGGTGITVTPDDTNNTITITATGGQTPAAHAAEHLGTGTDPLTLTASKVVATDASGHLTTVNNDLHTHGNKATLDAYTQTEANLADAVSKKHAQSHALTSADHTASGLTAGHVLRATGATTFAFGALQATDLPTHTHAYEPTVTNGTANQLWGMNSAANAKEWKSLALGSTGLTPHFEHTANTITLHVPMASTASVLAGYLSNTDYQKIHTRAHAIDSVSDHTATGLTAGHVLRASGSTAFGFGAIQTADLPTGIDAAKIANGTVSSTEFQYLDGVTSSIQTQLNGKADSSHTHDGVYSPVGHTHAGVVSKYSTTVGNGSATTFTVTHGLNTQDVMVSVTDIAAGYNVVYTDWSATDVNTVTITCGIAPPATGYRVTVIG